MNQKIEKCPVCGADNIREYDTMEFCVCEDYYLCKRCGYFSEMSYSPTHEGIELRRDLGIIRQIFALLKNWRNIRGLRLDRRHF